MLKRRLPRIVGGLIDGFVYPAAVLLTAICMRSRRPRPQVGYVPNPAFTNSKRCETAVRKLLSGDDRIAADFTPEERLLIMVEAVRIRYGVDPWLFGPLLAKARARTGAVCVAPAVTLPSEDLDRALRQPLGITLWRGWENPAIGAAYAPSYEGTRGAYLATSALRRGPHYIGGWDTFRESPRLQNLVTDLAVSAGRLKKGQPLRLCSYSASTRHLPKLSIGLSDACMSVCVEVVKLLARLYPEAGIGLYGIIDGTAVPTWTRQKSAKRRGVLDEALDAHYRRRIPEAEYQAIGYDRDEGQLDQETARELGKRVRVTKSWRGFRLIVLSEAITGIPISWVLVRGGLYELDAIHDLMQQLYERWPNSPLEAVTADKLWDAERAVAYLEVHYGVHLIAIPKPSLLKAGKLFPEKPKSGDEAYRGGISRLDGDGTAYCRGHDASLLFEGNEVPSRIGLKPGEPTEARQFRSRWRCPHGCGRLSLPTRLVWRTATFYPLNPNGRPDLYAMRIALQSRRSGPGETVFASLKTSFKQGLAGACRTRLFDKNTYDGLIGLAFATRALLMLADHQVDPRH